MNDRHSNSECVEILSTKEIEKNQFISKEYSEQLAIPSSMVNIFLGLVYQFIR